MKRYLVFIGDHYYPGGGMDDFREDFGILEDALQLAKTINTDYKWSHVFDIKKQIMVYGE